MRRRLLLLPVLAVGALVAVQARRLVAATTMEHDHAAHWRRRRRSPGQFLLVALGDSLAVGMGSTHPERSWAGRLAAHLEASLGVRVRVVNLGVCAATAADVARDQLPAVPTSALTGAPGTLVALAVGTNDAVTREPDDYRRDLETLCDALPAGSLVADVPDLQHEPVQSAGARCSAIARSVVAARPGLRLVRLEDATRRMRLWEVGPDLAHPNGRGYRRFGRAFAGASDASSLASDARDSASSTPP